MERILIVDDDRDFRFNLSSILEDEGYTVSVAADGKEALKAIEKDSINLALLDIRLPKTDGMKVLGQMKQIDKDLIIIMLTAYADIKDAVRAMKLGAYDYLTKPFDNEELTLTIKKALKTRQLGKEVEYLRKRLDEEAVGKVMGKSPQIKKVLKQVNIIAPTNMTVILEGESGAGKEVVANMIHQNSPRKEKIFVAIDCGAIPETLVESELFGYEKGAFTGADAQKEGKFEQANEGTLFLDEITNLPEAVQVKLLRVLEERKLQHLGGSRYINIDVRIIVATKANLPEAVRVGRFRDDLFHRLNEFIISLPALRERKEDIPTLAKCFLDEANQEFNKKIKEFSAEAMRFLFSYHWPGNVRELKNVIRRATLLSDSNMIGSEHLSLNDVKAPESFKSGQDLDQKTSLREIKKRAIAEIEQNAIKQALTKAGGNKSKAAKILNIDRMTLYSKIKEFQLDKV